MSDSTQVQLIIGCITIAGTALTSWAGVAYFAGKLTQRVADHDGRLETHELCLTDHGKQISSIDRRVSHIEGQRGLPLGDS